MKEIIVLGGKLYVQEKANNIIAKDGALYACDYEPDPNPENWRTINGAHVHIDNEGNIDGGAGGKFNGNAYKGAREETSLQKFKRWENARVDGMKTVAASNGKFTSLETHYPDGRVRKQYYESGRWTDTKPRGLAITHGHWQDKPYIVNINE